MCSYDSFTILIVYFLQKFIGTSPYKRINEAGKTFVFCKPCCKYFRFLLIIMRVWYEYIIRRTIIWCWKVSVFQSFSIYNAILWKNERAYFCLKSFCKDFSLSISVDLTEFSNFEISYVFVRNALYIEYMLVLKLGHSVSTQFRA